MKEEKIHKEIVNLKDFKEFDLDQEWNSFLDKVNTKESAIQVDDKESRVNSSTVIGLPRLGLSIAASLIILIGCMYFFNLKPETNIDPILAEQQVPPEVTPEKQIADPEPVVADVAVTENVTPKEIVQPKPTPKEKVPVAEQIIIENKPFAVTDIPKPNAPESEYKKYETGEILNLEDGSTIEILDVAIMKIPETFEGALSRNITIKRGNAEFTVTTNESQSFFVTTANSEVSVLGTTFRVLSKGIETTVKTVEGIVEFYSLDKPEEKYRINAGQEFKFDGTSIQSLNEPEVEEKITKTYLKAIEGLFKSNHPDKVNFKANTIKKADFEEIVELPASLSSSPKESDILTIIQILETQFDVTYKERGCDNCYTIESIRVKDNK